APDEPEPGRLFGIVKHGLEVRLVAGIGQCVEDRDPGPIVATQDFPDEAGPDEPRAAGDEQVRSRPESFVALRRSRRQRNRRGRWGAELSPPPASSSAAMAAARI